MENLDINALAGQIATSVQESLKDEFLTIHQRLDKMDTRLDKMDERLTRMETRLDKVEKRLDEMEIRLDKVEKRLDHMDGRISRLEKGQESLKLDLSFVKRAIFEITDVSKAQ